MLTELLFFTNRVNLLYHRIYHPIGRFILLKSHDYAMRRVVYFCRFISSPVGVTQDSSSSRPSPSVSAGLWSGSPPVRNALCWKELDVYWMPMNERNFYLSYQQVSVVRWQQQVVLLLFRWKRGPCRGICTVRKHPSNSSVNLMKISNECQLKQELLTLMVWWQ